MMGKQASPEQLFYDFCLDAHVPGDHLLRKIDRFLDFDAIRATLIPYYSHLGRPSVDPELLLRMLIVGYCFAIRSERRLCEEMHLNLAYRWFCGLGLAGKVPDHSSFSANRNGRFRDSDILRAMFETTVERCMAEGLVGGSGYSCLGAVVGATYPDEARALRRIMPQQFFLVPGYGAQGATAADCVAAFKPDGTGAIVNASRSVLYAFRKGAGVDWRQAVAAAARNFAQDVAGAVEAHRKQ